MGVNSQKKYPLWGIFSSHESPSGFTYAKKIPPMGVFSVFPKEKNTPYEPFGLISHGKNTPYWGYFAEKLPPMGVKILSLREKNTPYEEDGWK